MKSQDILLLLKLVSLEKLEAKEDGVRSSVEVLAESYSEGWQGWDLDDVEQGTDLRHISSEDRYSFRNLEAMTGISKSQVSESLKRSQLVNLVALDRNSGVPKVNKKGLLEFIVHGLKYVFPASPGALVRGIPTTFAAPVMSEHLMTAGESVFVWPDARGKEKGQAIEPLYKSVPKAVKQDACLYELLALIDSIRTGRPREANLAAELFEKRLFS